MITENLDLKLLSQAIVKDPPKLEFDFNEIFERNEFMKLIRDNVTKSNEKTEKTK